MKKSTVSLLFFMLKRWALEVAWNSPECILVPPLDHIIDCACTVTCANCPLLFHALAFVNHLSHLQGKSFFSVARTWTFSPVLRQKRSEPKSLVLTTAATWGCDVTMTVRFWHCILTATASIWPKTWWLPSTDPKSSFVQCYKDHNNVAGNTYSVQKYIQRASRVYCENWIARTIIIQLTSFGPCDLCFQ